MDSSPPYQKLVNLIMIMPYNFFQLTKCFSTQYLKSKGRIRKALKTLSTHRTIYLDQGTQKLKLNIDSLPPAHDGWPWIIFERKALGIPSDSRWSQREMVYWTFWYPYHVLKFLGYPELPDSVQMHLQGNLGQKIPVLGEVNST